MVKPGAAVVSAGTTFEGKKLIPDAHPDVAEVAGWITPRLGGVGPMTRAMLLRNALRGGAQRSARRGEERCRRADADGRCSAWVSGSSPSARGATTRSSTTTPPITRSSASSFTRASDSAISVTHKRQEHWFIVSGTATVTLDGAVHKVHAGESIDIPLESAHRIANEGDTDVVFIEVQRGTYFGEDDIVRLEDDYGRIEDRPDAGKVSS